MSGSSPCPDSDALRRAFVGVSASLAAAFAMSAGGASAQVVTGVLVEEGSGSPVQGAMIAASGPESDRRPLSMTDSDGSFRIDRLEPGTYVLRADRIGHQAAFSDTLRLAPSDTVHVEMIAPVAAIALEGIEARGTRRCTVRPEEGALTAQVWEEARKALTAAAWTQDRELYRYRMLRYVRVLDAQGRLIREEDRRYSEAWTQEPFTSHSAEHLTREGFVSVSQSGGALYYAPDARVLLSDLFLDTHCMGIERDPENHPGLLGLAFEPTEEREEAEIRGTLWLEEESGELAWLEFQYVNLGMRIPSDELGGRVEFHRMPDGTWIVREWWIRMPRLGTEVVGRLIPRERTVLTGFVEEGGRVLTVEDQTGEIVLVTEVGVIQGVVKDSLGQSPVEGARVRIRGVKGQEVTGSDGRFGFLDLGTGTYEVEWTHPALDSVGVRPDSRSVDVQRGEISTLEIEAPDPIRELAQRCEAGEGGSDPTGKRRATAARESFVPWILMGRVMTPDGRPMEGATVSVLWSLDDPRDDDASGSREQEFRLTANQDGHFLSCSMPRAGSVRVHARLGPLATDTVSVEVPEGRGPLYRELRVPGDGIRVPVPSILAPDPDTTEVKRNR